MTNRNRVPTDDLAAMLQYLSPRGVTERKVRLLAAACCRRVWDLLPDPRSRRGVEATEMYADGQLTTEQLREAGREAYQAWLETKPRTDDDEDHPDYGPHRGNATFHAANAIVRLMGTGGGWKSAGVVEGVASELRQGVWFANEADQRAATRQEELQQTLLCQEVFGHLLSMPSVGLDPEWRTAASVRLARGIYEDRAFDRLPILADSLMDSGCNNHDVLAHCREASPHVLGCWVVDLLLGKQ